MHIDHHPLIAEFPEHRDGIHTLKLSNTHFNRLAADFELVDKAITRVENGEEPVGDVALEVMKKQRLALKDAIRHMLESA